MSTIKAFLRIFRYVRRRNIKLSLEVYRLRKVIELLVESNKNKKH